MTLHLLLLLLSLCNAQMFGWPQAIPVQQMMNQGQMPGRPPTPVPVPIPVKSMQSMYTPSGGMMTNNRIGSAPPFSFNGILSNIKNFFSAHPSSGQQMPQIPPQLLSNPAFRQQLEQVLLTNPALAQSVMQSLTQQQNAAMMHANNQVQSRLAMPNPQPITNTLPQYQVNQANAPQSRIFSQGGSQQTVDDLFLLTAPFKITDDAVTSILNTATQQNNAKQRAQIMKQMLEQANPHPHEVNAPANNIVVHKVVPAEDVIGKHAQWASAASDTIQSQALPNILKALKTLPDNPNRSQLVALLREQGLLREPSLLSQASSALSSLQSSRRPLATSTPPTSIQAILKAHDEAKLRLSLEQPKSTSATTSKTPSQIPPLEKIPSDLAERLRGLGLNPDYLPELIRSANLVTNKASSIGDTLSHVASSSLSVSTSQTSEPSSSLQPSKAKDDKGMQGLRTLLQALPPNELSKVQNLIQTVVAKPHFLPRLLKEDLPPNIRQVLQTVQKLKFPETMTTTPLPAPVPTTTATTVVPATTTTQAATAAPPTTPEPTTTPIPTVSNVMDQIATDQKSSLALSSNPAKSVTVHSQESKVSTQATTRPPTDTQEPVKQASSISLSRSEASLPDKYIPLLYWMSQNGKSSSILPSSTLPSVSFNPQKSFNSQNQIAAPSDQQATLASPYPPNFSTSSTPPSTTTKPVEQPTTKPNNFALFPFIKNLPIEILSSLPSKLQLLQKPDVDVVHAGTKPAVNEIKPLESASLQNLQIYGLRTSPKPTIQFETTPSPKLQQIPMQRKETFNDEQPTIPLAALAAALEPKVLSTFLQSIQKKQEPKNGPNLFKIELSQESLPTSVPLSAVFNSVNLNSSSLMSFLNRFSNSPATARMLTSSSTIAPSTAPPPSYVSLLLPSSTVSSLSFFPFLQENKNLQPTQASTTLSPKHKFELDSKSTSSTPSSKDLDASDEDAPSHSKKYDRPKKPNKHQSFSRSSSEEKERDENESKHGQSENKASRAEKDRQNHFKHRPPAEFSEEEEKNSFDDDREPDREASQSQTHADWSAKHRPSSSSEDKNEHSHGKDSEHSKHGKGSHFQKENHKYFKHRPLSSSDENQRDDSREKYSSRDKYTKEAQKATTWHEKYHPSVFSSSEDRKQYLDKKHYQKDDRGKHPQKSAHWPVKSRSSASAEDDEEELDHKNSWKSQKENKYSEIRKTTDHRMKTSSKKASFDDDKKSDKRLGYQQKEEHHSSSEEKPVPDNERENTRRYHIDQGERQQHTSDYKDHKDSPQIHASSSDRQRVEIYRNPDSRNTDRMRDEYESEWRNEQHRYAKHPQLSSMESEKHEFTIHNEKPGGFMNNMNGQHVSQQDLQTQFADSPSSSQGWEPVIPFHGKHLSYDSFSRKMKENETHASDPNRNMNPVNREEGSSGIPPDIYLSQNPQRAVVLPEQIQPDGSFQQLQENPISSSKEIKLTNFANVKDNERENLGNQRNSDEHYGSKPHNPNAGHIPEFKTNASPPVKYSDWAVTPDYILSSTLPTKIEIQSMPQRSGTHFNHQTDPRLLRRPNGPQSPPRPNGPRLPQRPDDSQEDHLEANPTFLEQHFSPKTPPTSSSNLKMDGMSGETNTREQMLGSHEPPCTHKPNLESSRRDSSEMMKDTLTPPIKVKEGDNMAGSQVYQITSPFAKDKLIKVNNPLQKGRSYKPSYFNKPDKVDGKFSPQSQQLSSALTVTGDNLSRSKFKPTTNFKNSLWGFQGITDNSFNNYEASTQPSVIPTPSGQYDRISEADGFLPNYPETTTIRDLMLAAQVKPRNKTQSKSSEDIEHDANTTGKNTQALIPMASETLDAVDKTSQWPLWTTEKNLPQATASEPVTENVNMFYYNSNFTQPMSVFSLPTTENPEDSFTDFSSDDDNSSLSDTNAPASDTSTLATLFRPFYGTGSLWPTFSSANSGNADLPQLYNSTVAQHSPQDEVINNHTDVLTNSSAANSSVEEDSQNINSSFNDDNAASATDLKHVELTPPHVDVFTRIHNPHKPATNGTSPVFVPPVRKISLNRSPKLKPTSKQEVALSRSPGYDDGDEMFTFGNWPKRQNQNDKSSEVTSSTMSTTIQPRKIKLRWSNDKLGHRKILNSKPVNFYNFYQPNSETE